MLLGSPICVSGDYMKLTVHHYRVLIYYRKDDRPIGESIVRAHDKKEAERQALALWNNYNPKQLVCIPTVVH